MIWLLSACAPGPAPEPPPLYTEDATEPGWWSGAPVPGPRQEHGVVAVEGEVWVVAGVDDGPSTLGLVQAFDPAQGTWRDLPSLPVSVHHPNVVAVDGTVMVLGALDPGFRPVPEAWALDPGATAWRPLTPPPRDVGSSAVGEVDGLVHVVGGLGLPGAIAWHQVYDPATDTWTERADAPHARDHLAFGVIDGELVLTGGRERSLSAFVAATDIYDPATDSWRSGAPIPTPRGGVAAAVVDGTLHVVGGEGSSEHDDGVFPTHEVYDLAEDRWTSLDDMPSPRHGMGAGVVDGVLWVPGGAPVEAFGAVAVNEGYLVP